MPQPLPKDLKKFEFAIDDATEKRPELALLAAKVFCAWPQLEMTMGLVFNQMIHGDPGPTAAVFNSIRNSTAQRDAFNALSEIALSDQEDRDILDGLLKRYKGAAKNRDVLAHHLWATLPEYSDAIIMMDPKILASAAAKMQSMAITNTATFDKVVDATDAMRSAGQVWIARDFESACECITRTSAMAVFFMAMLPNHQRPSRDEAARKQLLSDPVIGEHVRSAAEKRKRPR